MWVVEKVVMMGFPKAVLRAVWMVALTVETKGWTKVAAMAAWTAAGTA
jgi:hypothetical protein